MDTPIIPQNIRTNPGDSKIALSWAAVNGALKYKVCHRLNGTSSWIENETTDVAYMLTGLENDAEYDILILSYDGSNWSEWIDDDILTATPVADKPVSIKPQNIKATPGTTSISFTWDAVEGATKYAVSRQTSSGYKVLTSTLTEPKYTAIGLTPSTTYNFAFQAYVDGKWSVYKAADLVSVKTAE